VVDGHQQVFMVTFQRNIGMSDANSLAISADGNVLVNSGPGGTGVVQLTATAGSYRLEWAYYDKAGGPQLDSSSLSGDGSVLAFFGRRAKRAGATGRCGASSCPKGRCSWSRRRRSPRALTCSRLFPGSGTSRSP